MKLRLSRASLPGALSFSLALWIALLPLFSSIHMALVPHVYSTEHHHFHEVVADGNLVPAEETERTTASFAARSSAASSTSIAECPLCDLALRQGLVAALNSLMSPCDCITHRSLPPATVGISWLVLFRAPKHSPPLLAA